MYNISLTDNSSELTRDTLDKVKLAAYLVYDALIVYEYEYDKNVLYKDSIVFNELYDYEEKYEFEHIDYNKGLYEPFMINDTSFGFTVYDNSISIQDINVIISEVKKMIGFGGNFNISSTILKNKRDRLTTINSFYPKASEEKSKKLRIAGILL